MDEVNEPSSFSDLDLAALVRMAGEAERLEEPAPVRFEWARAAGRQNDLVRRMTVGGLAAAACVALGAFFWMKQAPAPKPLEVATAGPAGAEVAPVSVAAKAPENGSVVMAFFHDADDRCSCVQLNAGNFKGDLAQVRGDDLVRSALANACHENPQRLLVIAMQGPKEALPASTAEAEVWAACVNDGAGRCRGESLCISDHAAPFIPAGVTMVTGSMGFGE